MARDPQFFGHRTRESRLEQDFRADNRLFNESAPVVLCCVRRHKVKHRVPGRELGKQTWPCSGAWPRARPFRRVSRAAFPPLLKLALRGLRMWSPRQRCASQSAGAGASRASTAANVTTPRCSQDPILGVTENFLADKNPEKMNLGVVRPTFRSGTTVPRACVLHRLTRPRPLAASAERA